MNETLTVLEALEKYPNAESKAFHLNQDKSCIYFLVEEPIFVNSTAPNGIQSYAKALKLIIETGQVLFTKVYIKKNDEIDSITFAKFKTYLDAGFEKTLNMKNNNLIKSQNIEIYTTLGYIK